MLKKSHQYYYQVQTQISVCGKDYGDFVVWTLEGIFIQRILPDPDFVDTVIKKAEKFFNVCIMPELVGKFYSRIPGGCIDKSGLENKATEIEEADNIQIDNSIAITEPMFCYCKGPFKSDMVGCDNPECPYQWFHFSCLGILNALKAKKWYCPDCRKLSKFCRTNKKVNKK